MDYNKKLSLSQAHLIFSYFTYFFKNLFSKLHFRILESNDSPLLISRMLHSLFSSTERLRFIGYLFSKRAKIFFSLYV